MFLPAISQNGVSVQDVGTEAPVAIDRKAAVVIDLNANAGINRIPGGTKVLEKQLLPDYL